MKSLITYFIKYPIASNLLMVGIFIIGTLSLLQMKSTSFPERESRIISIQTIFSGASPEEVEEGIVTKIEENLRGLTGVERVTSVSQENLGSVTVEVEKGYETDIILQDVKNAVDRISSFPVSMEPPVIYKRLNIGEAYTFALSGEVDLLTLKQKAREVEEELLSINGISKVALSGFPEEEIEVSFRERDLRAYQLTFAQASQAIRRTNLEITGGTLKGEDEELLIRSRNKKYYAEELRNIVVKNNPGVGVVRLHQVADVRDKWVDNPNRSHLNGSPAVIVNVNNTIEEDMLSIADTVRGYIEAYNLRNDIIKATTIVDNSVYLNARINLLVENGFYGFLIVLVLLALFLNWRLAFWVALAIPISFAGMFVLAAAMGITINVISLFGMILVIGILVDDGIVISESIYQRYEKGDEPFEAAFNGTMEVLPAVFSAILTTLIAFSTFFFLDGQVGDFFFEISVVVSACLLFSLVEGTFILPAHVSHSKALRRDLKKSWFTEQFERIMLALRDRFYAPILRFSMANKWLVLTAIFSCLMITGGAFMGGVIKGTFFPDIEFDNVSVNLRMPAGTREQVTEDWLLHIEEAVWEVNRNFKQVYLGDSLDAVLKVQRNLGPTTYEGTLRITMLDSETRGEGFGMRDFSDALRTAAGTIYGAEQVLYTVSNTFGKPVSISLVGSNYTELNAATARVKKELEALAELRDVVDNNSEGLREINIALKEKGRYLGLNIEEVVAQVRQGFFGSEVQRLQRGRDEVKVWVRYAESDRRRISQLENMRIRFADGREFPLHEIADLSIDRGVIAINHIDGKREVKVEAEVANGDVSVTNILSDIRGSIVPVVLADYPSVRAIYDGQNRQSEKTSKSFAAVMPIILLAMFFTIALTFRSISQTIVVFALIPFGLVGVAWGHYLLGLPISILSNLGVIALIGIIVNDALVFVTTFNLYLKRGMDQMTALYEASLSRFRPIVLTSVTTIAGLTPLLFEKSVQASFLIPMAVSVAFGLAFTTLIILVLLPVMLILVNRIKVYAVYAWEGIKPSWEEVEPAMEGRKAYFELWVIAGILALVVVGAVIYGTIQLSGIALG
ncbi:MAG: efflux RND transporter permease subunit [Bacteroidota bacterium]